MSNQRLPFAQWVNSPVAYTDKQEFEKLAGLGWQYFRGRTRHTCLLRLEQNTWGWAAVRDDNVGIAYWRDPEWKLPVRHTGPLPQRNSTRKFTEM